MVRESLARKFKPAGFEQPEHSRKNYVEPRRELQEAFYQWLRDSISLREDEIEYDKACKLIKPIGKIPYREANSLLFDFDPKTAREMDVGFFISACYNQSPEHVIIFDLDAPEIDDIGYMLGENKVLVNSGKLRFLTGYRSSGTVVNNGEFDRESCVESSGVVINNGWSDVLFGAGSSGIVLNAGEIQIGFGGSSSGIVIGLKKSYDYGTPRRNGRILKPADCDRIPELKNYLEELSEISRNIKDDDSARRFIETYGIGGEKIKPEIEELIERGGF